MALLRPITSTSINTEEYIKSAKEAPKFKVEALIKDYLFKQKKQQTLSQVQTFNSWKNPTGIAPDKSLTFDDLVKRIESNPNTPFSVADVWISSELITIISQFNRIPNIADCIRNLNYHNGLNWSALDTPSMYIAKDENDNYIMVSTKGGHRSVMSVLTLGFNCELPIRATYIGSLDLIEVCEQAAIDHHTDCNKRNNQTADDRIVSGTAADDYEMKEVMESLIDMKLYVKEGAMKSEKIDGFRKCTSWQSLKTSIKDNGYENTHYATEQIMKNTKSQEAIMSQSVEVIANFRNKFKRQIDNVNPMVYDTLSDFLKWYFKDITRNQSTLRADKDTQLSTITLAKLFNLWCQTNEYANREKAGRSMNGYKSPITARHIVDAFDDDKYVGFFAS
jgi:hypothetical protein